MAKVYDCVIIGGGVVGCATAYYLAKKGLKVLLCEKKYLCAGATGRCGGGIRQQWSTEGNTLLAMASRKIFENLSEELETDIDYVQGGYLILAYTDEEAERFKKNVEMQKRLGLEVEYLSPEEAQKIVPFLNLEGVKSATFCPTDGHANPFKVTYGYAEAAKRLGAEIMVDTEVIGIKVKKGRVESVLTNRGEFITANVVNASGGSARIIAQMVGIDIPCTPYRHEIFVTEPLNPLFDTMVISFDGNFYFRQAKDGGIMGGQGTPDEKPGENLRSSFKFFKDFGNKLRRLLPKLGDVKIVRHWAGLYTMTPDAQPIIGSVDEVSGFYQAVGFSGHGFMVAPVTAKILSQIVAGEEPEMSLKSFSYKRFKGKIEIKEKSVV